MDNVSHREYLTWKEWLADEWNRPNRSDWYAMQIAREVAVVLSSHPERVQVKDFKLVFEEAKVENAPPPEPTIPEDLFPPVAPEDLEDVAKAQWFRAVGYRPDGC